MKRILALIIIFVNLIVLSAEFTYIESKMKKVYLGKVYVSSYHASDNTPRYSRATSSGKKATVGRTIAVDLHDPVVPMGSKVHLQKFGKRTVEDVGDFGKYNNGQRKFDIYMPENKGGLWKLKAWLVRPETKKEKIERLKKEREKHEKLLDNIQSIEFTLNYDSNLRGMQAIVDPKYAKKGIIRIGSRYFDVCKTQKGLGNKILVGDSEVEDIGGEVKVVVDEIIENAVG